MIWSEWINSQYNTDGFFISSNYVMYNDLFLCCSNDERIFIDEYIENNEKYLISDSAAGKY